MTQSIPPEAIRRVIRPENVHSPQSKLVILENTHMGVAQPPAYFESVRRVADAVPNCKTKIHCDGARICNASQVSHFAVKSTS